MNSVDVRWASTYAMLRRYYTLRSAVVLYFGKVAEGNDAAAKEAIDGLEPSAGDMAAMGQLLAVLE